MPWRPLIPARHVRATVVVVAAALVVLVTLAVWLHDRTGTAFDEWVRRQLVEHISGSANRVLLDFSAPQLSVFVPAVVAVCAACRRRWDLVALAVATPVLATVLCELVGKPVVGRRLDQGLSFPSGHETGVSAAALVLAVALAQLPLSRRVALPCRIGLVVWVLAAGAGLVRADDHYASDLLGAVALTSATVFGSALLIDRAVAARARTRAPRQAAGVS
jgi:membrane-associated phospholipid phosphatase